MHDDLTKSAILYGTDKFGYHDYTPNYYKMFAHLRDKPIKVLEIGVGGYADDDRGGQSLEVWRDFFPNAEITGIDIQKKTMDLGPRVKILQGSQVDPEFLEELVQKRGPFDIIVDDGSHRNEHIVESYELLFPTLVCGGIYVAEDVQTSFHPRFGGSLEMTSPNSVGYFGELQRKLATVSKDPLIAEVAAMERFHNMIALHKKTQGGKPHDVFASNRFDELRNKTPSVSFVGGAVNLPFKTEEPKASDWGEECDSADLVVATVEKDTPSVTDIEKLFNAVNDGGIMVLRSDDPAKDFAPDGDLMNYAQQRFTMVDHVEILVHYPSAEIDALAAQIYSVERFADAILLYKSPNTYPSNFAFDAKNPLAKAAITHMGEILKDAKSEGGLVQYADIRTRHESREAAAETIAQLTSIGATSRLYYQMAGALAQREKRPEDAAQIFETALEKFNNDPQFTVMLAGVYGTLRRMEDAEALLREAYEVNPRARNVIASLSRVLANKGALDEAITLAEKSITLFPQPHRPARWVILADLHKRQGNVEAAKTAVASALALAPKDETALALQAALDA
ncbi:tetratricopeptide repeat protein [Roseovarius albus]|nr:tetratricopeptide repeat protein [Roseovarius albus]